MNPPYFLDQSVHLSSISVFPAFLFSPQDHMTPSAGNDKGERREIREEGVRGERGAKTGREGGWVGIPAELTEQ